VPSEGTRQYPAFRRIQRMGWCRKVENVDNTTTALAFEWIASAFFGCRWWGQT
jgi:hypothetical protein